MKDTIAGGDSLPTADTNIIITIFFSPVLHNLAHTHRNDHLLQDLIYSISSGLLSDLEIYSFDTHISVLFSFLVALFPNTFTSTQSAQPSNWSIEWSWTFEEIFPPFFCPRSKNELSYAFVLFSFFVCAFRLIRSSNKFNASWALLNRYVLLKNLSTNWFQLISNPFLVFSILRTIFGGFLNGENVRHSFGIPQVRMEEMWG